MPGIQHHGRESAPQPTDRLRYAVLMPNKEPVHWQEACLTQLLACDCAEPVLTIRTRKEGPKGARPDRGGTLWRGVRKLDRRLFPSRAWAAGCLPQQLMALESLPCRLAPHGKYAYGLSAQDIETVKARNLDFILAFLGYDILRGDILHAARYGVWSFHFGDPAHYRGAPPGVWEIHDRRPRSGVMLQRLTERLDAGIVLKRADFPTVDYSISRNMDSLYLNTVGWPAAVCRSLAAGNKAVVSGQPLQSAAPIRTAPTNRQAVRIAALLLANNLLRLLRA